MDFAISREVVSTEPGGNHRLLLSSGLAVCARTVVVSSGARYRRLNLGADDKFENRGLYYAATATEEAFCRDREVVVVGGGNSAGQASTFPSGVASHVHHIIRGSSLQSSMSEYLISRIERSPKISLYT